MFSKRKSFIPLMVTVFMLIQAPSIALAGESGASGVGGGGNYLGREFVQYARDGIDLLLINPCFPKDQIDITALRAKLELFTKEGEKRVKPTQDPLFVIDPNDGTQLQVDALNYPRLDLIELNVSRWAALSDQGKRRLASHEFFGLVGAEGSNDFHLSGAPSEDAYEKMSRERARILSTPAPAELVAVLESNPTTSPSSATSSLLWVDVNHNSRTEDCALDLLSQATLGDSAAFAKCEVAYPQVLPARGDWSSRVQWRLQMPGSGIDDTRFRLEFFLGPQSPYRFRIYLRALGETAGLIYESQQSTVDSREWIMGELETEKAPLAICPKSAR